ncbi:MAG: sigma-70 family RNA polymerase sigma factor [Marmoricola sp.]
MDPGQAIGLRLARRDEGALEEAFATYSGAVRAYVSRFVGPNEAEDVVQRTFLDVWRNSARYDPAERFAGWVFTIARRRAIDALRGRRHDVVDVDRLRDLVGEDGREMADRHADAAEVRAALAQLPEHERVVLEMAYFRDLSLVEIAGRLDAPVGTVKSRASRGTRRLALLLAADLDRTVRSEP